MLEVKDIENTKSFVTEPCSFLLILSISVHIDVLYVCQSFRPLLLLKGIKVG